MRFLRPPERGPADEDVVLRIASNSACVEVDDSMRTNDIPVVAPPLAVLGDRYKVVMGGKGRNVDDETPPLWLGV